MEPSKGQDAQKKNGERMVARIGGLQCTVTKEPFAFALHVENGPASAAVENAILAELRTRAHFGVQVDRSRETVTLHIDVARIGVPTRPELDWKSITETLQLLESKHLDVRSLYPATAVPDALQSSRRPLSIVKQAAVTAAEFFEKECGIRLSTEQRLRLVEEMTQSLSPSPRHRR